MVIQQLKVIFLSIIGLLRRALCCFSRRRKHSFSEPVETLQTINVVVDNNSYNNAPQRQNRQYSERDWNSWDENPRTVEEHIEQYRQRLAQPPASENAEPEPDLFSDLTPVIKPPPKYYLSDDTKEKIDLSRLEVKTDVPIAMNADLEDWVEAEPGDWEELDSEQAKQMIREKRREMRSQRQKAHKSSGYEDSRFGATRISAPSSHVGGGHTSHA